MSKPVGLENPANRCYLNSLSQLLILVPGLPESIVKDSNYQEYGNFLVRLKNNDNDMSVACYNPKSGSQKLYAGSQEDIHEYFTYILEFLTNKKYLQSVDCLEHTKFPTDPEIYIKYTTAINGVVSNCTYLTSIQLDIDKNIEQDLKPTLSQIDDYKVDNEIKTVYKENRYITSGYVFILLKIFDNNMQKIKLNNNYVLENIKINNSDYDLIGCANHMGNTIKSGHYISFVNYRKQWHMVNDNTVTSSRFINIAENGTPYLLLYKKSDKSYPQITKSVIETSPPTKKTVVWDGKKLIDLYNAGAFALLNKAVLDFVLTTKNDDYYFQALRLSKALLINAKSKTDNQTLVDLSVNIAIKDNMSKAVVVANDMRNRYINHILYDSTVILNIKQIAELYDAGVFALETMDTINYLLHVENDIYRNGVTKMIKYLMVNALSKQDNTILVNLSSECKKALADGDTGEFNTLIDEMEKIVKKIRNDYILAYVNKLKK